MHTIMDKFNNLILNLRNKTKGFVYSYFMPLIASLFVLLFWICDLQILGLFSMVLITCFVLIVHDDLLPIVSLMLMTPMCFRDTTVALNEQLIFSAILFSLLALSIILHFIIYPIKKIELDIFFYTILFIVCIFLLGGLFSGNGKYYFDGLGIFTMSGIVPLVIHFCFYNKIKLNNNLDIRKYVCSCFIIAISLACAQLCFAILHIDIYGTIKFENIYLWHCWSNPNHIASMILIAVPLCCYMMLSSKCIWAWFIELIFLYASVYFSNSDGALATIIIFTPFLMFAVYKNAYRRNLPMLKIIFYLLIFTAIIEVGYFYLFKHAEFLHFIKTSADNNGRTLPYKMSINSFLKHPILGIGLGGGNAYLATIIDICDYKGFYHSTFFHILACTGTVGIIGYGIYYLARIKYLLKNDTNLGKFALYAFIMFALYGLIENSEFNIVLMFMTTLISIVGLINKKGSDDKPLPLFVKIPKLSSLNQSCM